MVVETEVRFGLNGLILFIVIALFWCVQLKWSLRDAPPSEIMDREVAEEIQSEDLVTANFNLVELDLPVPPPKETKSGSDSVTEAQKGRHGPNIQISWPLESNKQEQLYRYLHKCQGMRLGVLLGQRARLLEKKPLRSGAFSSVVRLVQGPLTQNERILLGQSQLKGAPLRMFPASFDQKVNRALRAAFAQAMNTAQSIRAQYLLVGEHLLLKNVSINGNTKEGLEVAIASGCQNY